MLGLHFVVLSIVSIIGLFHFSEGKPCPERTQAHLTHCNMFYRCIEITTNSHVWVPKQCEPGLIYEHSLGACVLPSDDWECLLPCIQQIPLKNSTKTSKDMDFQLIRYKMEEDQESQNLQKNNDEKMEMILEPKINLNEEFNDDGSGMSGELVELDGLLPATDIKNTKHFFNNNQENQDIEQTAQRIDPKLTAQLQRLAQLIDGLKKTYQKKTDEQQELRPDQLNAFLAHFNIRNQYESFNPKEEKPTTEYPKPFNMTRKQWQGGENNLKAETKFVLNENFLPKQPSLTEMKQTNNGFSKSKIVINHPEGTVTFTIPQEELFLEKPNNIPKISKETLNTVLELSKQMVATPQLPQILTKPAYYAAPIIQPVVYTSNVHNTPFSSSSNKYGYDNFYSNNQNEQINEQKKPFPQYAYEQKKPSATIIHNNVHVTAPHYLEKDNLDSYGQSLNLYPPLQSQMEPEIESSYSYDFNKNNNNNNNGITQTMDKEYTLTQTFNNILSSYLTTVKPSEFFNTPAAITQYFTPSQHLNNHNVNMHVPVMSNYATKPQQQTALTQSTNSPFSQQIKKPISSNYIDRNENIFGNYPNNNYKQDINKLTPTIINQPKPAYQVQMPGEINESQESDETLLQSESIFSNNENSYFQLSNNNNNNNNNNKNSIIYLQQNKKNMQPSIQTLSDNDNTRLVKVGDNFINLKVFRTSILPLLNHNVLAQNNIEVITCAAGVRQANVTDCTRYYVCSKKDGKVLSYTCPNYTAFNTEKRMCDATSYNKCHNNLYAIETYKKYQSNRNKPLSQNLGNYENLNNDIQPYLLKPNIIKVHNNKSKDNMLQLYIQQAAAMANITTTTARPPSQGKIKKRTYYCKEGDKIPDQNSVNSYFACYKNAQGQMKGHKMTCSNGLIFCPKITMCTLTSRCI